MRLERLEAMSVGILCLTPENVEKPWILFEAGALSKAMGEKTRVCPYLFGGLRSEQVRLPLGMFQAARAEKEETRKLVFAVNRSIGGVTDEGRVDTWFEREWPELEKKLGAISTVAAAAPPERPEKEMVAELLELSRAAAANVGWSREALTTLLKDMNRLIGQAGLAGEARIPLSALGGGSRARAGDAISFWANFVESAMKEPVRSSDAVREIAEVFARPASEEERAERARLIREILDRKKKDGGPEMPKKSDEKK